eukprot:334779-Chlamydomonas_euryale.AAC.3
MRAAAVTQRAAARRADAAPHRRCAPPAPDRVVHRGCRGHSSGVRRVRSDTPSRRRPRRLFWVAVVPSWEPPTQSVARLAANAPGRAPTVSHHTWRDRVLVVAPPVRVN